MDCIGCDLANKKVNTYTIYDNKHLSVILDLYPYSKGHLLILPKVHYENFNDLPNDLLFEIMKCAQTMVETLKKTFNIKDIIILQNNGSLNSLKHFHLHIIPHDKNHNNLNSLFDKDAHEDNDLATLKQIQSEIINTFSTIEQ